MVCQDLLTDYTSETGRITAAYKYARFAIVFIRGATHHLLVPGDTYASDQTASGHMIDV